MKTTMQEMIEWLQAYEYEIPLELQVKAKELLEKEKDQIMNDYENGWHNGFGDEPEILNTEEYYNQNYNQNK